MEHSLARRILAVFCGGFCGTLLRVVVSGLVQDWLGSAWPYDILLINITGALLLAFLTTLADAAMFVGPTRRLLLNVGFLGAYTTFSSLALGDVLLAGRGEVLALLYLLLSVAGGLLAVLAGDLLARRCILLVRRSSLKELAQEPVERPRSTALNETISQEHIDLQDDLLT